MHRRKFMKVALLAGACVALAPQALAGPVAGADVMPLGHRMVAPAGFRAYCQASPENCLNTAQKPIGRPVPVRSSRRSAPATGLWAGAFAQARDERDVATGAVDGMAIASRTASGAVDGQSSPATGSGLWSTAFSQARGQRALATGHRGPASTMRPDRSDWALAPSLAAEAGPVRDGTDRMQADTPRQVVAMDRSTRALLQRVNNSMNQTIQASRDEDLYGADVWGVRMGSDGRYYGDCEDYALAKRDLLIRQGIPAQALSLVVARTRAGETHAVLVVTTDRGDYVLDNLSYWVRPWREVDYRWIARQNAGEAGDWRAIASDTKQAASGATARDRRRS